MPNTDQPIRIIVEVVSHADVRRLEERDEEVRREAKRALDRAEAVHRALFEYMERKRQEKERR